MFNRNEKEGRTASDRSSPDTHISDVLPARLHAKLNPEEESLEKAYAQITKQCHSIDSTSLPVQKHEQYFTIGQARKYRVHHISSSPVFPVSPH
jgi:hypothetical protein